MLVTSQYTIFTLFQDRYFIFVTRLFLLFYLQNYDSWRQYVLTTTQQ